MQSSTHLLALTLVLTGCVALTGCMSSSAPKTVTISSVGEPSWSTDKSKDLEAKEGVQNVSFNKPAKLGWAGKRIHPIQENSFDKRSESSPFTKSPVALNFEHERGYYTTSVEGLTKKVDKEAK